MCRDVIAGKGMCTMKTKVFFEEFKGNKMFAVWEVDDQGNKVGQYPLFSLGSRKAIALSTHLEDFKDFANSARVEAEKKARK
jgi:hypothetical protein